MDKIKNNEEYYRYAWTVDYDNKFYDLMKIKLEDFDVELGNKFMEFFMSMGGDYYQGRKKWLDNNKNGIKKLQESGFCMDIYELFEKQGKW